MSNKVNEAQDELDNVRSTREILDESLSRVTGGTGNSSNGRVGRVGEATNTEEACPFCGALESSFQTISAAENIYKCSCGKKLQYSSTELCFVEYVEKGSGSCG